MSHWHLLDEIVAPRGFRAAGVRAGIKTSGPDLALIVSDAGSVGAAVFTQNCFCAAPVVVSREHSLDGHLRAIFANSGCANACTGATGLADAREMACLAADALGIHENEVLVASTGIIGQPLPMDLIRASMPRAAADLSGDGFARAADAILTTDTRRKAASVRLHLGDASTTISGMVKGSGMVAPNMATVFGFFATDTAVEPSFLREAFARAINRSINRVTVDGDTSTNDTACILSSGAAGNAVIESGTGDANLFEEALTALAIELARQLARDGEGANHLVTVRVTGAASDEDADAVAKTIANSPLVKTAIFGQDPNWGRIAMAAGRAGVPFDPDRARIWLNGVLVTEGGMPAPFDADLLHNSLKQEEIDVRVDLGAGSAYAIVWTCDFSYDYVKINAEYHT